MPSGGSKNARNRTLRPTAAVWSSPASTGIWSVSITVTLIVSWPNSGLVSEPPQILTSTKYGESR